MRLGINLFGKPRSRPSSEQNLPNMNTIQQSTESEVKIDSQYNHNSSIVDRQTQLLNNSIELPKKVVRRETHLSEIKLVDSASDRKRYEDLSDLYSIIRTTESIEAAYSRDAISEREYSEICQRLISQFKTIESALLSAHAIENVQKFMSDFSIDCPRAYDRLVRVGVPATVIHGGQTDKGESVIVAETVQAFITAMDALKLDLRAVDEVHPLISELMSCITRVPRLPPDYEGTAKIEKWLKHLNQMRAAESIDENDARQLVFDLESSYSAFHKHLASK